MYACRYPDQELVDVEMIYISQATYICLLIEASCGMLVAVARNDGRSL